MKVAHQFYDSICEKTFSKTKVIVSSHHYQLTPSAEDLGNLVAIIQAIGADIVKIATTALDITDVAHMFQIMVHSQVRHTCLVIENLNKILSPCKYGTLLLLIYFYKLLTLYISEFS